MVRPAGNSPVVKTPQIEDGKDDLYSKLRQIKGGIRYSGSCNKIIKQPNISQMEAIDNGT